MRVSCLAHVLWTQLAVVGAVNTDTRAIVVVAVFASRVTFSIGVSLLLMLLPLLLLLLVMRIVAIYSCAAVSVMLLRWKRAFLLPRLL